VAVAATILFIAGLFWINNSVEETTEISPLAVLTEQKVNNNTNPEIENIKKENSILQTLLIKKLNKR
jgi:hypothetical protein